METPLLGANLTKSSTINRPHHRTKSSTWAPGEKTRLIQASIGKNSGPLWHQNDCQERC